LQINNIFSTWIIPQFKKKTVSQQQSLESKGNADTATSNKKTTLDQQANQDEAGRDASSLEVSRRIKKEAVGKQPSQELEKKCRTDVRVRDKEKKQRFQEGSARSKQRWPHKTRTRAKQQSNKQSSAGTKETIWT